MFNRRKNTIFALLLVFILSACNPNQAVEGESSKQEMNSNFSIPVLFGNGKKGQYVLIGEEAKFGFQIGSGTDPENIELLPIIANKPNKYMWYLWGDHVAGKSFKVIGTNTETKQETVIIDNFVLGSALNGADAHIPTSMVFPTSGNWNLDVYVEEELFGNIIVDVN